MMKIAIGSDHAGVGLKEKIKSAVEGVEFLDFGTNSEESTDYPTISGRWPGRSCPGRLIWVSGYAEQA